MYLADSTWLNWSEAVWNRLTSVQFIEAGSFLDSKLDDRSAIENTGVVKSVSKISPFFVSKLFHTARVGDTDNIYHVGSSCRIKSVGAIIQEPILKIILQTTGGALLSPNTVAHPNSFSSRYRLQRSVRNNDQPDIGSDLAMGHLL